MVVLLRRSRIHSGEDAPGVHDQAAEDGAVRAANLDVAPRVLGEGAVGACSCVELLVLEVSYCTDFASRILGQLRPPASR